MTRYHGYPPSAPYVITEPPRRGMRFMGLLVAVIAAVLIASPFLPDVIRVTLPEKLWRLLPSVEFLKNGAPDPVALQAAADSAAAAERQAAAEREAALRADAKRIAEEAAAKATAAALAKQAASKPKPKRRPPPPPPPPSEEELEPDRALWPDRSMTIVPTRVIRSVEIVNREPGDPPASDPVTTLLCVQVVDPTGEPVEGVRVDLVEPPITVRTDARGRFCLSCPPGARTLHIEHPGYAPVTRDVQLSGMTIETRVALTPDH